MNTPVAIIGGGPCGLLSSLYLSRLGVKNVVLEKHPDISFHPKAMGTSRKTAEIFRQLGLLDAMLEKDIVDGVENVQVWLRSLAGEEFGRSPRVKEEDGSTPCKRFHCPQPHTESVLRKAVEREERSELRFNSHVTAFVDSGEDVSLTVENRETGEVETLQARWVIAADGAASAVREKLGIETYGPGDRGHFLNVYFRADYSELIQGRESQLYSLLDDEYYELMVAVNGKDEWLMHHFLQPGESPEDYSAEAFQEIIQGVSGAPEIPVEVISISPWVMSPKVAAQWRSGRIFLTGDAAARLSPAGGLGMNNGLQSAANLAWKLAAVVHGQAAEGLLDTYGRERSDVVKYIFENAEGNADEVFEIVGMAMCGNWDGAKEKIRHSRRSGSGAGVDLGLAYGQGALVPDGTGAPQLEDPANEYIPTGRPGHRAPHIPLEGPNGETSSIDLFGLSFVLIVGPDGGPWQAAAEDLQSKYFQGVSLRVEVIGESLDVDVKAMLDLYGISSKGAILVRPDGYVAARWAKGEGDEFESFEAAVSAIFGR